MFCPSQNSKCQEMPKFQFPGGERGEAGGGGSSVLVKTQRAKICLNFNSQRGRWCGWGVFCTKFQNRVFWPIWSRNSGKPSLPLHQIVSHILHMWRLMYYRPQTKCRKVMFLHLSVCSQGEGVCPGGLHPEVCLEAILNLEGSSSSWVCLGGGGWVNLPIQLGKQSVRILLECFLVVVCGL